MNKIIYPLFLTLFLTACSQHQAQIDFTTEPVNTGIENEYNEAFLNASEAQLLFKEDQSIAYFIGKGNEYAAFKETTHWLSNEYVEVMIDNGGSIIYRYFYVKDQAVYLMTEVKDSEPTFTLDQLQNIPIPKPMLHVPLAVGAVTNDWHIVDLAATVVTPYKTFENAIVFEKQTMNETNRIYIVMGFGIVKNEFIVNVNGDEETITSSLSAIDYE